MTVKPLRASLYALAAALTLAACGGGGSSPPPPAVDGAPAADGDARSSVQITGAGATFIYPLLSRWSADYNQVTGVRVNYQSIGSGGGIAQIKAGTVDFGSSDKPLSSEELAQAAWASSRRRSAAWSRWSTWTGLKPASCA